MNWIHLLSKIHIFFGVLLFFLLAVFPFQWYILKLFIIILFTFVSIILNKLKINYETFGLFTVFILHGIFWVSLGIINGKAEENSYLFTTAVYILFPLFYFYIGVLICSNKNTLRIILKYGLKYALFGCIGFMIYIGLSFLNIVPKSEIFLLQDGFINASLSEGSLGIKYHGITSLIFIMPFYISKSISINFKFSIFQTLRVTFIVLLFLFIAVITSRRALILCILISPFLHYIIKKLILDGFLDFVYLVLLISPLVIGFSFYLFTENSSELDDSVVIVGSDDSDDVRTKQLNALLDLWVQSPILGTGHGVKASIERNEKPWRYELSYIALLAHVGLLGSLLYLVGVFYIYARLFSIYKSTLDNNIISILVAFTCILVSYSSNPYLDALDTQWTFFLPFYYIMNYSLNGHSFFNQV